MRVKDLGIPATATAGTAFGLTISEFVSEYVARVTGQTGWAKIGVKGGIKAAFGLIFYGVAQAIPEGLGSLFLEMASYVSFGSIVPDVLFYWNPGGLIGAAEKLAAAARGAAKKSAIIQKELMKIDQTGAPMISASRT